MPGKLRVTDEVLGVGTYAQINGGNPDPRVQAAILRWSIRPCLVCGRGVKCEPGYPADVQVACWRCIRSEG